MPFTFQVEVTTLSIVPVVNNEPQDGQNVPSSRASKPSSASFYLSSDIGGIAYFRFPYPYLGNNIKSYGGYLTYRLTFKGTQSFNAPDIILMGSNGIKLFHTLPNYLKADSDNEIQIRFWNGLWTKDNPRGPYASREDILMSLADVKEVLIRAQYTDYPVDVTITNLELDTASPRDVGLGQAVLVEQCLCPEGYAGISCQQCAPGYQKINNRQCVAQVETCPSGYYGDPSRGIDCRLCPCPLTIQSNQ